MHSRLAVHAGEQVVCGLAVRWPAAGG